MIELLSKLVCLESDNNIPDLYSPFTHGATTVVFCWEGTSPHITKVRLLGQVLFRSLDLDTLVFYLYPNACKSPLLSA